MENLIFKIKFYVGVSLFALMFLYMFRPFGIDNWIESLFGPRSLAILYICSIAIASLFISQIIQYYIFKNTEYKFKHLLIIFFSESLIISLILSKLSLTGNESFANEFSVTYPMVFMTITLCYTMSYMILSYISNHSDSEPKNMEIHTNMMFPIYDDSGQLRFSVHIKDLLMFESDDNYVIVHYMVGDEYKKQLVRTTLKKIEVSAVSYGCVRCHRSYIINSHKINHISKNGRTYEIKIQNINNIIPVSLSYKNDISKLNIS